MSDHAPALWERQPDESALWWERFRDYRDDGPGRSLLEQVNRWRVSKGNKRSNATPGSWRRNAEKWQWVKRAFAFDEAEIERKAAEAKRLEAEQAVKEKRDRDDARKARRRLIAALNDLSARATSLYAEDEIEASDLVKLATAITKLNDDSRAEFGDLPVTKIAPTNPAGDKEFSGGIDDLRTDILGKLARIAAGDETAGISNEPEAE